MRLFAWRNFFTNDLEDAVHGTTLQLLIDAQLDRLNQAGLSEWELAFLRRKAESRLADTRALLGRQPIQARAVLKQLFDAPLSFSSVEEEGRLKFVVEGTENLSTFLVSSDSSLNPPRNVVSPTGPNTQRSDH